MICLNNLGVFHVDLAEKAGLDVLVVHVLVHVPEVEVAKLPEDPLHAGHDVVNEPAADPLVHDRPLLRHGLDVEKHDQGLDDDALDIGGGDEHLSVDEMDQRQGNGDKLVHSSQLGYLQSVSVVLARLTRMTTPRHLKMVKRTMVRMVT